jgi:hypothetical protein
MSSKTIEYVYVQFHVGLTDQSTWVLKKLDLEAILYLANFLSTEPKDSE